MRITAAASVLILAALSVTAIPIELHQHHRRGLGDVVNGVKETGAKLWEKLQTIIHRPPKTPTNLPKPVEALHAPEQAIVPVRAPGQPIAPNVASDVAAPKVASNVAAPKVASNVAAPVGDAASVANKAPTKVGFLQKLTSPFKKPVVAGLTGVVAGGTVAGAIAGHEVEKATTSTNPDASGDSNPDASGDSNLDASGDPPQGDGTTDPTNGGP